MQIIWEDLKLSLMNKEMSLDQASYFYVSNIYPAFHVYTFICVGREIQIANVFTD